MKQRGNNFSHKTSLLELTKLPEANLGYALITKGVSSFRMNIHISLRFGLPLTFHSKL